MNERIRFNQVVELEAWTVNGVKIPPENIHQDSTWITIQLPREVSEGDELIISIDRLEP